MQAPPSTMGSRECTVKIASMIFGIILAYFRSKIGGQYTFVDIAPQFWIENRLKRTRKSTEESLRYTQRVSKFGNLAKPAPGIFIRP